MRLHLPQNLGIGLFVVGLHGLHAGVQLVEQGCGRVSPGEGAAPVGSYGGQPFHVGHPHLDELVEVIGIDSQKTQPLEQGHAFVARLLKHPAVEGEPAQLPVVERRLIRIFRHGVSIVFFEVTK